MPEDENTMPAAEADTGTEQDSVPSQENAPAQDAAQTEPVAHGDQPTNPVAPDTKADDGSLTNPHKTTEQQQPPQRDWTKEGPTLEKRLRDQQSHFDRKVDEWRKQLQQTNEKASGLEKWKQEQEQRAQAAALKPWSKDHPENIKFSGLLERAKVVDQQLRNVPTVDEQGNPLPPAHIQTMRNAIIGALSSEEQKQINEYRDSQANFQRDWFTDPHATLRPMMEPMVKEIVEQAFKKIEAQHAVQQDFADPQLAPLLKEHGQDFARALQEMGNPDKTYDYAKQMMLLYAENQKLKAEQGKLGAKAAHADEQRRLVKDQASHTRDPRAETQDPYDLAVAEAKKRGIPLDSPRFAGLITKYSP
jgi:hypothetical protein